MWKRVGKDCWCHLWKQFNCDTALKILLWMGLYWYLLYPLSLSSCMVIFLSWSSPPINWLHVCTWISECFRRKITQPPNYSHIFIITMSLKSSLKTSRQSQHSFLIFTLPPSSKTILHLFSFLKSPTSFYSSSPPWVSLTLQFLCAIRWQVLIFLPSHPSVYKNWHSYSLLSILLKWR